MLAAMKDLAERRILIVDDAKANVDILVHALKDEHALSVALDGESALKSIQRAPPDLVLLDVVMPGIDGYEVCRRLRSDPATRDLPVMFLTSLDEVGDKMKGFEAGGTDYVTKPFEVLEVKARVRSLLKAKAYQEAREEALTRELRIAREIQMGLVTSDFSRWKEGPLDVFGLLEPAKEVGGDLFSIFPLDERRVVLVIGDVSGKGIPAALYMAITNALLRTFAHHVERPEDVMTRVNAELSQDNRSSMFVTLFVAVLDLETGLIRCCSGGHCAPVVARPDGPARFALEALGTVVGVDDATPYRGEEIRLQPGDTLVVYTDGVTEAFNPAEELYGDERLLAHLSRAVGPHARATVEDLLADVRRHAAGAPQSDDIAIVALRWGRR